MPLNTPLMRYCYMQGEMIDRIESNVDKAADYISEGVTVITQCVNVANQRVNHGICVKVVIMLSILHTLSNSLSLSLSHTHTHSHFTRIHAHATCTHTHHYKIAQSVLLLLVAALHQKSNSVSILCIVVLVCTNENTCYILSIDIGLYMTL